MLNVTKITDYLLVYLLVAFSGVPFFYKAHIAMLIVSLALPAFIFVRRKRNVDRFFIYYVVFVLCIQVGQMLKFYEFPIQTYLGLHVRVLFAYLSIKAVGKKMMTYYVDILVFSVWTSLFFYVLSYVGSIEHFFENSIAPLFSNPLIKETNYKIWPSVILYTFNAQGEGLEWLKRNSGPFWEPGAFSGFLMVALLFNIIISGQLNNKKNRILMLGVLSTFSTSGLLVLVVLISFYLVLNRDLLRRYVLVPIVVITGIIAFFSVDFLGSKVVRKMSYSDATYNTRFKSAQIDINDFMQHPVLGMGRSQSTRFHGETEARAIHRNNGVTNHLVMYGAIAFLIYFYLIYLGFYRMCRVYDVNRRMAFFALIIILLIGFSQIYFTKVFFIAMTLIPVLYCKDEEVHNT
ncbi:O-antigen ligase family protein [Saccharicrinis fermentans]|uniref:O-antigen ligase-related domain-containing protein n=1 Tax=Saccharicrinis fermentans DSM 9555 = JCM 21142 TaxID=869213 RepID=W7YGZ6_9BACT|nr:O-antigen ligase family protein [Saccharicrinis fermentans]GAF03661.1 hypothetical protein JCM21142_52340 [Saccharicrinis fermentans DSM 9555 = JCM 21142]